MKIAIPHRYLDRLEYSGDLTDLHYIIVGTYNPGKPDIINMDASHQNALEGVFSTDKFKRNDEILNFYDRSQNRFWGIMDRLDSSELYARCGSKFRNKDGLKHYKEMDRTKVYDRQLSCCRTYGIFITDLVKTIVTDDFHPIYNNFSDAAVDKAAVNFNTAHLKDLLRRFPSAKLIFTVNASTTIPRISNEIRGLKEVAGDQRVLSVLSPSGAAKKSYETLIESWGMALQLH